MSSIVVVDESPSIRETLAIVLGRAHHVVTASTVETMPSAESPALVILGLPPAAREIATVDAALGAIDARVPLLLLNRPGKAARDRLRRSGRRVTAVPKPFELHVLRAAVDAALIDDTTADAAIGDGRRWLGWPYIGRNAAVLLARAVAADLPMALVGEPGTGAADVARALHEARRREGAFVACDGGNADAIAAAKARSADGTLFIADLDRLASDAQHALLGVMRTGGAQAPHVIVHARTRIDPLAPSPLVPDLAFALAALVVPLPPLRERAGDVAALVVVETARLAPRLALGPVTYTGAAMQRLTHYLWFGNVAELEAVVARTLALQRREVVELDDLLFDVDAMPVGLRDAPAARESPADTRADEAPRGAADAAGVGDVDVADRSSGRQSDTAAPPTIVTARPVAPRTAAGERRPRPFLAIASAATPRDAEPPVAGPAADWPTLEVLVGEIAHELRNPMVTIKTFAQHLDSVLADPEARARFSALTGEAVTRMDALLETLLDFARFRAPHVAPTDARVLLERALGEHADELARKEIAIERTGDGTVRVDGDEAQLLFAFRSVVAGLVPDLLPRTALRFTAESGRVALRARAERTIAQRLGQLVERRGDGGEAAEPLPLAFAMAAALIRRNGGVLRTETDGEGTTTITIQLTQSAPERGERGR